MLAGVSTDWYTRLEKGHITGVSDDVLDAVARALRLDEAERAHLFDLARTAHPRERSRRRSAPNVRPGLRQALDAMTDAAAIIRNGRMDILATNQLGRALYWPILQSPDDRGGHGRSQARPANIARFAAPDTPSHDALRLLATWAATLDNDLQPHNAP